MRSKRPAPPIVSVRRKSALLAAVSVVLAGLGLEAYARGYPLGLSMLAASTVQAGICCAMFRSAMLKAVLGANVLLVVFHASVTGRLLALPGSSAMVLAIEFCCAVLAAASLVFMPIETIALVVREAYRRLGRTPA